jgi:hypothetical protein
MSILQEFKKECAERIKKYNIIEELVFGNARNRWRGNNGLEYKRVLQGSF